MGRKSDFGAAEAIFRQHADLIYRVALHNLQNPADAEDILQEVCLVLLTKRIPEDEEHRKRWLIRVTINKCRDLSRSYWRRNRESLDDYQHLRAEEPPGVMEELEELSESYRNIIYLYYYEEYTVSEIAEILKKNVNTVKSGLPMRYNAYTTAVSEIHVSEDMVERAIKAAKQRAAARASAQIKTRYAAVAASVVLASVAGGLAYNVYHNGTAPIKTAPISIATEPTEAIRTETQIASEQPTVSVKSSEATAPSEPPELNATENDVQEAEAPAATETPQETLSPTEQLVDPTEPIPTEVEPTSSELPHVGFALIFVSVLLAETGLGSIDDPNAFSDQNLYYIETKFGRYYRIQPLQINPEDYVIDYGFPASLSTGYLYNSNGTILREVPIWW